MSPDIIILLLGLVALMALGIPICFAMMSVASVILLVFYGSGLLNVLNAAFVYQMQSESLLAIPMFALMAAFLQTSGIGGDIYEFFHKWLGGINIATAILVLICMGLVFIYGINIFLLSFRLNERISSVWGSPMWTIRFWVPLGAALMFIQAISELIKNVAAMAGKIELTNNSDEVAEAIEIVKSAEHLPDETGKEDIQ